MESVNFLTRLIRKREQENLSKQVGEVEEPEAEKAPEHKPYAVIEKMIAARDEDKDIFDWDEFVEEIRARGDLSKREKLNIIEARRVDMLMDQGSEGLLNRFSDNRLTRDESAGRIRGASARDWADWEAMNP